MFYATKTKRSEAGQGDVHSAANRRSVRPAMTGMSYEQYLASPRWRRLREQALQRDGRSCRLCGSPADLEVHHRQYPPRGQWRLDSVDNLTTLCTGCHHLVTCHQRAQRYATLSHAATDVLRTTPAIEVVHHECV